MKCPTNASRCPLHTDDRRDNFDIYLPLLMARYNKEIFGTLYVAGLGVRGICASGCSHSPDWIRRSRATLTWLGVAKCYDQRSATGDVPTSSHSWPSAFTSTTRLLPGTMTGVVLVAVHQNESAQY
jgi:hypothetical protein